MLTAQPVTATKVGVSPGTTTFRLGDAGCDSGPRAILQRMRMFVTNVLRTRLPIAVSAISPRVVTPALPPGTPTARAPVALSPYGSFEELNGRGLGYILNVGPTQGGAPYGEIVATMKQAVWQNQYCGKYDKQYHQNDEPGMYYDTKLGGALGAIPSDLQLSRVRGYTPVMSSWVPFQGQTWAPAPWVPPNGTWTPYGIRPIGPPISKYQLGDATTPGPTTVDPAAQVALELKQHQDRVFALTVVSTAAVTTFYVINILKHIREEAGKRKRSKSPIDVPAAQAAISGFGRARRHGRGRR